MPDTPVPTATPFHPDHSRLAVNKLALSAAFNPVFFTLPGMDPVSIASVPYKGGLTMDVYYPPEFDFSTTLPAIIFVNGIGDPTLISLFNSSLKDTRMYISWGQLVGASGLIGVDYETTDNALRDTLDLITFVVENGSWLGLDPGRICLWSASSNTPVALDILTDTSLAFSKSLSCAVVYYGETKKTKPWRSDVPLFIVKAGKDDPAGNSLLDGLAMAAQSSGAAVTLVAYDQGVHAFDIYQDTADTHRIVKQTLEFMKANLTHP